MMLHYAVDYWLNDAFKHKLWAFRIMITAPKGF